MRKIRLGRVTSHNPGLRDGCRGPARSEKLVPDGEPEPWSWNGPEPIVLSDGAHKYREQIDELVSAFESFPRLSEAFQAYAGKFGGTFARLLLTMHVIENCPGWAFNECLEERERLKVVSEETARRTLTS